MSTKYSHGLLPNRQNNDQAQQKPVNALIGNVQGFVIIQFSEQVRNYMMTVEQAQQHVRAVQSQIDARTPQAPQAPQ